MERISSFVIRPIRPAQGGHPSWPRRGESGQTMIAMMIAIVIILIIVLIVFIRLRGG